MKWTEGQIQTFHTNIFIVIIHINYYSYMTLINYDYTKADMRIILNIHMNIKIPHFPMLHDRRSIEFD